MCMDMTAPTEVPEHVGWTWARLRACLSFAEGNQAICNSLRKTLQDIETKS